MVICEGESNFVSKPFEHSGVEIFTVLKDIKRNNEIESKIIKYILDKTAVNTLKRHSIYYLQYNEKLI